MEYTCTGLGVRALYLQMHTCTWVYAEILCAHCSRVFGVGVHTWVWACACTCMLTLECGVPGPGGATWAWLPGSATHHTHVHGNPTPGFSPSPPARLAALFPPGCDCHLPPSAPGSVQIPPNRLASPAPQTLSLRPADLAFGQAPGWVTGPSCCPGRSLQSCGHNLPGEAAPGCRGASPVTSCSACWTGTHRFPPANATARLFLASSVPSDRGPPRPGTPRGSPDLPHHVGKPCIPPAGPGGLCGGESRDYQPP